MTKFILTHPLRINLPDGTHVRFQDLGNAAASALHYKLPIWDEKNGQLISLEDCVSIVNRARRAA